MTEGGAGPCRAGKPLLLHAAGEGDAAGALEQQPRLLRAVYHPVNHQA